jgi:hypothetical protein
MHRGRCETLDCGFVGLDPSFKCHRFNVKDGNVSVATSNPHTLTDNEHDMHTMMAMQCALRIRYLWNGVILGLLAFPFGRFTTRRHVLCGWWATQPRMIPDWCCFLRFRIWEGLRLAIIRLSSYRELSYFWSRQNNQK